MRRSDREVTNPAEQLEIIRRCDVCRLALNGTDGWPYILPLNFGAECKDGQLVLYFHGANSGTKYELMARDSRASFEMDCCHELFTDEGKMMCTMAYQSVIGQGELSMVPEEEKQHALEVLMAHYHLDEFPVNPATVPHTTVFQLKVLRMTGKHRRRH